MAILGAVGIGFLVAWVGFPVLAWLARRAGVRAVRCSRMRAALLSTTAIPLVACLVPLWPKHLPVEFVSTRAFTHPAPIGVLSVVSFSNPVVPAWMAEPLAWLGALWVGLLLWGGSCELEHWLALRELRRRAKPAPTGLQAQAVCLAGELQMRAPTVFLSNQLKWAGAAGVRQPVVILPGEYEALSTADLLLVLRHELLHLKRRDPTWGIAERWCAALLGWHPFLARFRSELQLAREAAVDSLAAEGDVAGYARLLVDLAERSIPEDDLAWVPMAGASLEKRILMILDPVSPPHARLIPLVAGIGALGALAVGGSAAVAKPVDPSGTVLVNDSRGMGILKLTGAPPSPEEMEPRTKRDIDACFELARAGDPNLVVDTVAYLELDDTGRVTRASIPASSETFQTCIEERALAWHFAPPPGAPKPKEGARLFLGFPVRRGLGD